MYVLLGSNKLLIYITSIEAIERGDSHASESIIYTTGHRFVVDEPRDSVLQKIEEERAKRRQRSWDNKTVDLDELYLRKREEE